MLSVKWVVVISALVGLSSVILAASECVEEAPTDANGNEIATKGAVNPMLPLIGAGISAAGSLLGGVMANNAAKDLQASNIANQLAFAKHGIQWKVEDAKRAGVHPLFALGANTSSFSNVTGDNSLGTGISEAGQNLGRAVSAMGNQEERAIQLESLKANLEKQKLENTILGMEAASRVRLLNQPGSAGPAPSVGAPVSGAGAGGFPVTTIDTPKLDPEKSAKQIRMLGLNLANDPWTSDAQTAEDVLGEGVSDWLWPFLKVPSLGAYNWMLWRRKQVPKRDIKDSPFWRMN